MKVFVTFNSEHAKDGWYATTFSGYPGYGYERLLGELGNLGAEVITFNSDWDGNHFDEKARERNLRTLKDGISDADLIFHDGLLVLCDGLSRIDLNWAKRRKRRISNSLGIFTELTDKMIDSDEFITRTNFSPFRTNHPLRDKEGIATILYENGLPVPKMCSVNEFLKSSNGHPVILKKKIGQNGNQVFMTESSEDIKKFFSGKELVIHIFNRWPSCGTSESSKTFTPKPEEYFIMDFIETPGNYDTNFGIYTFCDGTILCATLNTSMRKKKKRDWEYVYKKTIHGISLEFGYYGEEYVYFYKPVSNLSNGGRQIPLFSNDSMKPLSTEDKFALFDHDIDPDAPHVPEELVNLTSKTARLLGKHGILFCRQDWIMGNDGKFYFLEAERGLSPYMFVTNFGKGDYSVLSKDGESRIGTRMVAEKIMNFQG